MNKIGLILYMLVSKIIPYIPGWSSQRVRVMLIDDASNVLLVRSWLSKQLWSLPGGGVERGETPEHASVREIKEETGFSIDKSSLQFVTTLRNDQMRADLPIFLSRIKRKDFVPLKFPYSFEIIDRKWFPLDQLPRGMTDYSAEAIALALLKKS
ncbi:MAG: NUDIX hydrolase [Candidatus Saccharimonadales bacterium]